MPGDRTLDARAGIQHRAVHRGTRSRSPRGRAPEQASLPLRARQQDEKIQGQARLAVSILGRATEAEVLSEKMSLDSMPEEPEFEELWEHIFQDPLLNENEYFEVLGVFQDLVLLECCHMAPLCAFAPQRLAQEKSRKVSSQAPDLGSRR